MADVFISYRNTPVRRIIVRRLATILRAHEISVWWDYGLEAGESYRAQITAELASARVVSPLWCAESIQSPWVKMEAELGKDKLVPARLQKVVPPDSFEAIQAADLIGWDGAVGSPRVQEFVRLICKRLGRAGIAPTDLIEDLGQLPAVAPLPEVAPVVAAPSTNAAGPAHDYAFWERQWERYGTSDNLIALRGIADDAPRLFANQAKARIIDRGWGRGRQPAIDVSWNDAKAYCAWLSAVTGKAYRLPSEAEWEQACRAGTDSEFWWGNEISTAQANYDCSHTFGKGKKGEYRQRTLPVDSFEANPWGLYQVHGNVWEYCEDAYDTSSRVLRGGSWYFSPVDLRSSNRSGGRPDGRVNDVGFRVARAL